MLIKTPDKESAVRVQEEHEINNKFDVRMGQYQQYELKVKSF